MRKVLGDEAPKVKALHAGLECGVIGNKLQGMDMVRGSMEEGVERSMPHSAIPFAARRDLMSRARGSCKARVSSTRPMPKASWAQ